MTTTDSDIIHAVAAKQDAIEQVIQKQIIFVGTYEQLFDALAKLNQPYPDELLAKQRQGYIAHMKELEAGEFTDCWSWDAEYLAAHAEDSFEQETFETREGDYPR